MAGKRGLWLGDSLSAGNGDKTLPDFVAKLTGSEIVNASVGGTLLSQHKDKTWSLLSGASLAAAIADARWGEINNAVETLAAGGHNYRRAVARLQNADLRDVDFVVIAYGTNDASSGAAIGEPNDEAPNTVRGAVNIIVSNFVRTYPHLRLYFLSPLNNQAYADVIVDQATRNAIPAWSGTKLSRVNKHSMRTHMSDGTHLRPHRGEQFVAQTIASFLIAHY